MTFAGQTARSSIPCVLLLNRIFCHPQDIASHHYLYRNKSDPSFSLYPFFVIALIVYSSGLFSFCLSQARLFPATFSSIFSHYYCYSFSTFTFYFLPIIFPFSLPLPQSKMDQDSCCNVVLSSVQFSAAQTSDTAMLVI